MQPLDEYAQRAIDQSERAARLAGLLREAAAVASDMGMNNWCNELFEMSDDLGLWL